MVRRPLRSTFHQIRVQAFAAIGIVAAIAVAWWMKVENARAPHAAPQIAFGEPVKVGRAVFTPRSLVIRNAPPSSANGSGRKLVLAGQLENATGESQVAMFGFPEELPALSSGGTDFPAPTVYLDRDHAPLKQLQPRIREAVSIVWDVPESWREQEVTVAFSTQQFKLRDNLYAKASWLLFHPSGTLRAQPEVEP